ncbi:MAG TPA: HigA family addiction module antitoxin [Bryobacteraceae bacterium]
MANKPHPVHPGEILREDVLIPLGMSMNQLAKELKVPAGRLSQIVKGQRAITADTSLRLARYLGSSPRFWLNIQVHYDMEIARLAKEKEITRTIRPRAGIAA